MVSKEELGVSQEELEKITAEVLTHSMNPENYGELQNADAKGKCINSDNGDFAIVFLKLADKTIEDISFVSNGCKDIVIAGSLFTAMVKGDSLEHALTTKANMETMILKAPPTQKDVGLIILNAFDASVKNIEDKSNDIFTVRINEE